MSVLLNLYVQYIQKKMYPQVSLIRISNVDVVWPFVLLLLLLVCLVADRTKFRYKLQYGPARSWATAGLEPTVLLRATH